MVSKMERIEEIRFIENALFSAINKYKRLNRRSDEAKQLTKQILELKRKYINYSLND